MSKAEEIRDKILKIINNRPQHIHQVGKDSWMSERVLEILEQYAAEVSRERAVEFTFDSLGHNDHPNSNEDPRIKAQLRKRFDNWIKEQEEL